MERPIVKLKTHTEGAGSGTAWLNDPGRYHFAIMHIDEQPKKQDGVPIDGIKVSLCCLAPGDHARKQWELMLFQPNPTQSEKGQDWALRKITAFLLAAGLITEAQLGQEVNVDLQAAVGRHLFAELDLEPEEPGKKRRLQLRFANIFHVDNPEVADAVAWPRNQQLIAALPAAQRRSPETFPKREHQPKQAAAGPAKPAAQPATNDDFDGI